VSQFSRKVLQKSLAMDDSKNRAVCVLSSEGHEFRPREQHEMRLKSVDCTVRHELFKNA
jgi:hypothetical protein